MGGGGRMGWAEKRFREGKQEGDRVTHCTKKCTLKSTEKNEVYMEINGEGG